MTRKAPTHERLLVRMDDYNGHKDVLFMMKPDDFRLADARFKDAYTVLATGRYEHRSRRAGACSAVVRPPPPGAVGTLRAGGAEYTVFADWSLRVVEGVAA